MTESEQTSSLQSGGYARREVQIDAGQVAGGPLELTLAPAFGPLFSALLAPRKFRVRTLALEYVAPERLGPNATYSARLGAMLEGGHALELSLVIARGALLCVRGAAVVELEVAEARPVRPASSGNALNGSSRSGGAREKDQYG